MDIGIDQIGFYTPNKFVDMVDWPTPETRIPTNF